MLALLDLIFSILAGIGGFVVVAVIAVAVYVLHVWRSERKPEFTKDQLKEYARMRNRYHTTEEANR